MRGIIGVELYEELETEQSSFPVALIASQAVIPKVLAARVYDLVMKPVVVESLRDAITRATDGEEFADEELERAFRKLTPRELEITALVVEGKSSGQIGAALAVSRMTVETHRTRIMYKTRADDVGHLARLWRAWNQATASTAEV